jgi:16S rRNA (guanine527-N7)-methyltransferase
MREQLQSAAQSMGVELSAAQTDQLLAYMDMIQKWNKVYNLTAVRDPQEMLTHHLLDSLSVVAPLRRHLKESGAQSLLDVGSGAGLPGVVIAVVCPELAVTCVDTVGKKASFIQQVALSLKLPNLRGVHARVEAMAGRFDVVTSRAFASLLDFVSLTRERRAEQGVWMAMKARTAAEEAQALPADVAVFHVEPLAVPGLDETRCLVWLAPKSQVSASPKNEAFPA